MNLFPIYPESSYSYKVRVFITDSVGDMHTLAISMGYKLDKDSVAAYLPLHYRKLLGYILLAAPAIDYSIVTHEVSHAISHWSSILRLDGKEVGSKDNERIAYATGKMNEELIKQLQIRELL